MSCNELAALRLGLMTILGRENPSERLHEEAELGDALTKKGPLKMLAQSPNLAILQERYSNTLVELEETLTQMINQKDHHKDNKKAYLKTLLVLTRKVEMELKRMKKTMESFYEELEDVHDFVHELYPES